MEAKVTVFNNEEFGEVRTVTIEYGLFWRGIFIPLYFFEFRY